MNTQNDAAIFVGFLLGLILGLFVGGTLMYAVTSHVLHGITAVQLHDGRHIAIQYQNGAWKEISSTPDPR